MDVWVVEAGYNYEQPSIMGVRSSEAGADALVEKIRSESTYDWVGHSQHTVDEHLAMLDSIT